MKTLFLFDIDGTMVDMTNAHVRAYQEAYLKVTGVKPARKALVRQFGNTERKIQEAMFRRYGIKDKSKIGRVTNAYIANVEKHFRKAKVKLLPGVKKVLDYLKSEKQPLGVVTGNTKGIGEEILKRVGIHGYFGVYSYGNVNKRAHIVRNAIRAARKRKIKFGKVVVVGDAPFDVHAGKANRAITVAVATGRYSYKELKKEKPDLLLKSLITLNTKLKQGSLPYSFF